MGRKQNLPPRLQRQQDQQKQQQQRPPSPQPGAPAPSQQQPGGAPGAGVRPQGRYPWPYGGPQPWAGMPPMAIPWDMRMSGGRPPMDPQSSGRSFVLFVAVVRKKLWLAMRLLALQGSHSQGKAWKNGHRNVNIF